MRAILALLLVGIMLFGCTDTQPQNLLTCPDGTLVSDLSLCATQPTATTHSPIPTQAPVATDDFPPLPPG